MKIFLDDSRETPLGWVRAYWPEEVIHLLQTKEIEEVSLDHDLGDDDRGTGYTVILWIEEAVALRGFVPPKLRIHSDNGPGIARMRAGIESIEKLYNQKEDLT